MIRATTIVLLVGLASAASGQDSFFHLSGLVDRNGRISCDANSVRLLASNRAKMTAAGAKSLVAGYLKQHADQCEQVNSERLEAKLAEMSREELDSVESLGRALADTIGPNAFGLTVYWPGYTPFLDHFRQVHPRAPAAVARLLRDRDHASVSARVAELVGQCGRYVDALRDLIELVAFDAETRYEEQYGSEALMSAWINYEYCRRLVASDRQEDLAGRVLAIQ